MPRRLITALRGLGRRGHGYRQGVPHRAGAPTVHDLVAGVLEGVQPASHLGAELRSEPWLPIYALYARARGLLRTTAALEATGRLSVGGEALVRAIFELGVTAFWLDDDLETNVKKLVQAGNRDLRNLAEAMPDHHNWYEEALRRWESAYGNEPPHARLPSLQERLRAPYTTYYKHYRLLSSRLHPGLVNVDLTLTRAADGGLNVNEDAQDPWLGDKLLPFAAINVWVMGVLVCRRLGVEPPDEYMALGEALNSLLNEAEDAGGVPEGLSDQA